MASPKYSKILHRILRPKTVALGFCSLLIVSGAWQWWRICVDRPVTPTALATREVKINQKKLDELNARFDSYHKPLVPLPVLTTTFTISSNSASTSGD